MTMMTMSESTPIVARAANMSEAHFLNRLCVLDREAKVKFADWFIGMIVSLTLILFGSAGMFLYSVSFVEQPMAGMAPIDKFYTSQIGTIMVFITGVLGGVAGRSGIKAVANAVAKAEANDNEPPAP